MNWNAQAAPRTFEDAVTEWQAAVQAAAAAKDNEMELRLIVANLGFKFDKNEERKGTENIELGDGYKLKAVFAMRASVNNKDDAADKMLTKLEKTGPEGKFIADRIVKWKPELSLTEYNQLDKKFKAIVDEVVTFTVATPALELVVPKDKKV